MTSWQGEAPESGSGFTGGETKEPRVLRPEGRRLPGHPAGESLRSEVSGVLLFVSGVHCEQVAGDTTAFRWRVTVYVALSCDGAWPVWSWRRGVMSEGNLHGLGLCFVRELGVLVLFCCVLFILWWWCVW